VDGFTIRLKVNVVHPEPQCLAYFDTGSVEQGDDRSLTRPANPAPAIVK
jgi:hypothetical protein